MLESLEVSQVFSRMKDGNPAAFSQIVERYQLPIQRYLFRLTGNYETAQDLAQDTFTQAYESILKDNSSIREIKPFLYKIAFNRAFDSRRRKNLLAVILFKRPEKPDAGADNHAGQIFENMAINEAFLKVPADRRACMELHFIEGFNYREIGEIIGISEEAVRKRISRGTREFRKVYGGK